MKKNRRILALVLGVFIVFILLTAHAQEDHASTVLVIYPEQSLGKSDSVKNALIERQLVKIVEEFRLTNPEQIRETFLNTTKNGFEMKLKLARGSLPSFNIDIVRGGKELYYVPQYLQQDDTIRFFPETKILDDWFPQGGLYDSPPVELVSQEVIEELIEKFNSKYPYNCNLGKLEISACEKRFRGEILDFHTERENISSIPDTYPGLNDYPVYVVPFEVEGAKNAYAGVQAFRTLHRGILMTGTSPSTEIFCSVSYYTNTGYYGDIRVSPNKKESAESSISYELQVNEILKKCLNDALQSGHGKEEITSLDIMCRQLGKGYYYVDKIFFADTMEAVQADWLLEGERATQVIAHYKMKPDARGNPPEGDFTYEFLDSAGEGMGFRFIANARDLDGVIASYEWDFGDGSTGRGKTVEHKYAESGEYSVTLTVTDNDGLTAIKTKTIDLSPKPLDEFIAEYNQNTKNLEITLTCQQDTILIDIDQLNKQANTILAVIEKQPIPCNQTTKIGPIETTGYYQTTATLTEQTKTAHFTIP